MSNQTQFLLTAILPISARRPNGNPMAPNSKNCLDILFSFIYFTSRFEWDLDDYHGIQMIDSLKAHHAGQFKHSYGGIFREILIQEKFNLMNWTK